MKIAFFSNFLNHHQLPLCKALLNSEGVEFTFVATMPIEKERLDMGYEDMNLYPFVLRSYESDDAYNESLKLAVECDVMIFGAAPISYLNLRMNENKLTFYFTERILRKGYYRRFIPQTRKKINERFIKYKDKPLYILCASAFASYDLSLCGFDINKCFKWGYFPEIKEKDVDSLLMEKSKKDKVEILYAGRLLKLKRVIDTVKAVKLLKNQGYDNVHFTIIGDGEQKQNIAKYINKNDLSDCVTILPFMPAKKVREYMDLADVYVFSSNIFEGWGAVMNEALNSACAVVVSHAVGSAPFLINNGENGLIYKCKDYKGLASSLKRLLDDKSFRDKISRNGYNTVSNMWNADVVAERFLNVLKEIENNKVKHIYDDGVLSFAEPLKNNWIKGE